MSDFIKTTLGEISENFDNIRVPLSSQQRIHLNKIYPYYGAQNIIDYVDDFLFDGEYILVAEDGENLRSQNNNVCNLVQGKFWVNNHAHIIRASEGNNTKYLCYLLNLIDFKPFVTGSAQPKLTKENLHSIPLTIHNNNSQSQIAKVLSDLDAKIELNNKINAELEAMAKLMYDYWFVQFEFPNEDGKPYKSSGGKMVWNEELKREIPEGWEVKNLFESCRVQYGFPFSTDFFNTDGNGYPVIRIRDILDNSISNFSTQENVDPKYLIMKGDVLIGMDGNFHINYWSKNDSYLNQRVVKLSESILPSIYLRHQVEPYIKLREKSVSRTTVGHLSDKDLKAISILIPEKKILSQMKELFQSSLNEILTNQNQNQQLAELRDWLLPMLMNGQVRVK